MRVHLGANDEGYRLARTLQTHLAEAGHDVHWHAAPALDEGDDYPAITIRTMRAVVADEDAGIESRGVVVGGAGAGEVIAANKVNGARAIAALSAAYVADARRRADVNLVVIPAAHADAADAYETVAALVEAPFSGDLEDARRLVNVAEFETSGTIEGWMIES